MKLTGILHCHSTYSYDAKIPLRDLKVLLQKNGIQFVCMTEHTDELTEERAMEFIKECEHLSDETFLFIPGFEVPYKDAHILMIGTRRFYERYAPTVESLTPWVEAAPFVVLAHPVRNHFEVDDGLLEKIDALEVWNQQYEGKRVPRIRSLKLFSALKSLKPTLIATGGVDLHRSEHMGSPTVELDVEAFSEVAILEKLTTGAFVVSSKEAHFYGSLLNATEIIRKHRFVSHFSVCVIVFGKWVNAVCAHLGFKLPKWMKRRVRRHI